MAYVNATVGSNTAKVTSVTDGTNTLATLAAVVENDSNLTVTANGTYNATQDGYKKVVVNVASSSGLSGEIATGEFTMTNQYAKKEINHGLANTPNYVMCYLDAELPGTNNSLVCIEMTPFDIKSEHCRIALGTASNYFNSQTYQPTSGSYCALPDAIKITFGGSGGVASPWNTNAAYKWVAAYIPGIGVD